MSIQKVYALISGPANSIDPYLAVSEEMVVSRAITAVSIEITREREGGTRAGIISTSLEI
jgi:hypothetical protein